MAVSPTWTVNADAAGMEAGSSGSVKIKNMVVAAVAFAVDSVGGTAATTGPNCGLVRGYSW